MTIAIANSNLEVQEMFDIRSFFSALVREEFDALTIGQILSALESGKGKWLITVDNVEFYAFPL